MNSKLITLAIMFCVIAIPAFAAPTLNVAPGGIEGGNWVWNVSAAPDLALGGTADSPLALALGFRLTNTALLSVANANSSEFDTNLSDRPIFGWETPYGSPPFPEGLEVNCASCTASNLAMYAGHAVTIVPGTKNEIFVAIGSIDLATSIPRPFLKIVGLGPGNGGPASSTIEWLGAYDGKGKIAQIVGGSSSAAFFYAGTVSQTIPEPASCAFLVIACAAGLLRNRIRR